MVGKANFLKPDFKNQNFKDQISMFRYNAKIQGPVRAGDRSLICSPCIYYANLAEIIMSEQIYLEVSEPEFMELRNF